MLLRFVNPSGSSRVARNVEKIHNYLAILPWKFQLNMKFMKTSLKVKGQTLSHLKNLTRNVTNILCYNLLSVLMCNPFWIDPLIGFSIDAYRNIVFPPSMSILRLQKSLNISLNNLWWNTIIYRKSLWIWKNLSNLFFKT